LFDRGLSTTVLLNGAKNLSEFVSANGFPDLEPLRWIHQTMPLGPASGTGYTPEALLAFLKFTCSGLGQTVRPELLGNAHASARTAADPSTPCFSLPTDVDLLVEFV
jgi:hypothetical protein